jgi:hypothetical protein
VKTYQRSKVNPEQKILLEENEKGQIKDSQKVKLVFLSQPQPQPPFPSLFLPFLHYLSPTLSPPNPSAPYND